MTIDTQKLLSLFDTAAQTYGWAGGTGTVGQFQTALTNYQKARGDLEQALDAQAAEIARLREAAKMLADWAEHEVGAEPSLTPGLTEVRAALSGESNG